MLADAEAGQRSLELEGIAWMTLSPFVKAKQVIARSQQHHSRAINGDHETRWAFLEATEVDPAAAKVHLDLPGSPTSRIGVEISEREVVGLDHLVWCHDQVFGGRDPVSVRMRLGPVPVRLKQAAGVEFARRRRV